MTDKDTEKIVKERIAKIEEAIEKLRKIKKKSKEEFLKDSDLQYIAFYALILAIEAICDIGNHLLAKYFNRATESYREIILALGECGVVPQNFAQKNAKMTDFRNVLIHLYTKINPEEVYKNLQKAPEEFSKFAKYFLKFLGK